MAGNDLKDLAKKYDVQLPREANVLLENIRNGLTISRFPGDMIGREVTEEEKGELRQLAAGQFDFRPAEFVPRPVKRKHRN